MPGNLEILIVKTNWLSSGVQWCPNKTIFFQEKKPLGKQSKNSQPQNSLIYSGSTQERTVERTVERVEEVEGEKEKIQIQEEGKVEKEKEIKDERMEEDCKALQ